VALWSVCREASTAQVVAALATRALGKERVLGVFMPERDSSDDALRLGKLLADHLGIQTVLENIGPGLKALGCYDRQTEAISQGCADLR